MVAGAAVLVLLIWIVGWWVRGWRRVSRAPAWPGPPRRARPYLADVATRAEDVVQCEASRMMASGEIPFDRDAPDG
jgi:hypothetical protein